MKNLKRSLALLDDFFSSTKPEEISALVKEVDQTCNMDISLDEYFSSMNVSFSVIIADEDKYILSDKEIVDIKAPSILIACEPLNMKYDKRRKNVPYKMTMTSYNLAA